MTPLETSYDEARRLERVGAELEERGLVREAVGHYLEAIRIKEALAKRAPHDASLRHDLALSHVFLGDSLKHLTEEERALEHYRKGLALLEDLARGRGRTRELCQDMAECLIGMGDALRAQGSFQEAEASYAQAGELLRDLDPMEPG